MSVPVISVMMPCYNARQHLPWALGAMLAQTFNDWELVLVDDGSTDHPEHVVEQAADPRIRLIRLPENRGRGHARQIGLDNARGEFLAMLDADDWMYPERLALELDVLTREPSVGIVSAGMAITDARNEVTGVRLKGDGTIRGPHHGLAIPMAHAPSMLRRSIVGPIRFDPKLLRGQDADFLRQVIQGQRSIMLPDLLYVYQEAELISGRKAIENHRYSRMMNRKHLRAMPYRAGRAIVRSWLKELAYRGAASIGRDDLVTQGKQVPATADEIAAFESARARVAAQVQHTFGARDAPASMVEPVSTT